MRIFILLCLLLILFLLIIFVLIRKIRPWWKKLLSLVILLIGIFFTGFMYVFPVYPAVESTGDYSVKTESVYVVNDTQITALATSGNEREIPVKLWFPEANTSAIIPLIIFSHGSFGIADSNESLFLELTSHGYAVASLDHLYHSFVTTLSDGTSVQVDMAFMQSVLGAQGSNDLETSLELFTEWQAIRVEDLNAFVDHLLADNIEGLNVDNIDTEQLILAGHSLGGSAVLDLGRMRSDDFVAVIALEAPFFGDIVGIEDEEFVFENEEYPLPVLHFYSDALWSKLDAITTYEMNSRHLDNSAKFVNVHIEGSGHIGLTDLSLVSPILTNLLDGGLNTKDPTEKLKEINVHTLEFLNDVLN